MPDPIRDDGQDRRPLLGILGGTFDPIHLGHLRLAEEIAEVLDLDRVHFVPSAIPPHRPQPALSAEMRLDLVSRAIADNPRFIPDDRELRRAGSSFTIDTLQDFRRTHPNHHLVLLLGMDAFNGLMHWHRWQELLSWTHIAVATRPGTELGAQAGELLRERSRSLAQLQATQAGGIRQIEITRLDISATAIRQALGLGHSVRYLVPESLLKPLDRHYSAPRFGQCDDV